MPVNPNPDWVTQGKTIKHLIEELKSFSDQDLEVRISLDDGATFKPISLVIRKGKPGTYFCGLVNCESDSNEQDPSRI